MSNNHPTPASSPAPSSWLTSVTDRVKSTASFLWEHKKKVALVGVVVGGVYAYRRLKPTWDEIWTLWNLHVQGDKSAQRALLEQRFRHCLQVCVRSSKTFSHQFVRPMLSELFPVQKTRLRLKQGTHDMELWNTFKLQGFARTFCAMYEMCLLHTLMYLQLTVVSRYEVIEPLSAANRGFMNVMVYARKEGMEKLCSRINAVVRECVSSWDLKAMCTLQDLRLLVMQVRDNIENVVAFIGSDDVEADDGVGIGKRSRGRGRLLPDGDNDDDDDDDDYDDDGRDGNCKDRRGMGGYEEEDELDRIPFQAYLFPPTVNLPTEPATGAVGGELSPDDPMAQAQALMENPLTGERPPVHVRVAEMVEEMREVMRTVSYHKVLKSIFDLAGEMLLQHLEPLFVAKGGVLIPSTDKGPEQVAFAKALMRVTKIFDIICPSSDQIEPPLLTKLNEESQLENFCQVMFFPLEWDSEEASADGSAMHGDGRRPLAPDMLTSLFDNADGSFLDTARALSGYSEVQTDS